MRTINHRKRAEEALRASEARYAESLLRDASTLGDAFHPDGRDEVTGCREAGDEPPETSHWEGRIVVRGETQRIRIGSKPTVMPDGTIVRHGIVEDITERG